ncbi:MULTISPECIES: acyltransferase family protein [unclassified Pigmentiphaga]|uniref:acyltransferase family protein n=1 Tax=unclassified Pigmentiphaga TaxID=2626614 RepID=UPI000B4104A4|nr:MULTISPECIES: acyltransferase [unclassified Pigmentiphaga]OVZ62379.1 hypothetical protein CDO46_17295 [Pigmentiphaga sp. NML030171]
MNSRDLRIETLRGLACILLVAYHVIGDDVRGLRLPDDAWLRWFSDSLVYLRMPLFTFLSGYVYAMRRPAQAGDFVPFFRGKVRRLLLPLLMVGQVYQYVQRHVGEVNVEHGGSWFRFMFYAYDHFWFLQALFLIFIIIYVLDVSGAGRNRRWLWTATLLAFLVLPHIRFAADPFSINGAFYLLPYFLLGVALRRTPGLDAPASLPRYWLPCAAAALLVCLVWHQASLAGWNVPHLSADALSGQLYSAVSIAFLYAIAWQWKPLVRIGGYSYSIYLFHVFGTAGCRILLTHLNVHEPVVLFACGLASGILLPILLETVLDRWGITRLLFLGKAYVRGGSAHRTGVQHE